MAHKHVFECVDRSFKSLRKNEKDFGGVTVVFSGDWKQILPVVKRGLLIILLYLSATAFYLFTNSTHCTPTQPGMNIFTKKYLLTYYIQNFPIQLKIFSQHLIYILYNFR